MGDGFQRSSPYLEQLPVVATFVGEGMVKERVGGHISGGEGDNAILAPDCRVFTRIQAIERGMHLGVVERARINNQTPLMSGDC